jgi:hypothetical protein
MAIRFDAAADQLSRTAFLPSNTAITVMGWARIVADTGAGALQPLYQALSAANDGIYLHWEGSGADGLMSVGILEGGVPTSSGTFASRPAVGVDFAWYLKCGVLGTDTLIAGWRADRTALWVLADSDMYVSVDAPTSILFGSILATYFMNGRLWNIKCWDRALTTAEIDVESRYREPQFWRQQLNFWWALDHSGDTFDRGPRARHATKTGTLTTEPSPVVLLKSPQRMWPTIFQDEVAAGALRKIVGARFSLAGIGGGLAG